MIHACSWFSSLWLIGTDSAYLCWWLSLLCFICWWLLSIFFVLSSEKEVRFLWSFLLTFLTFVQTQFSCKQKTFQSGGGTKFINHRVCQLFSENGTHHQMSCPYIPHQNSHVERKHRHLTETGLALLFGTNAPANLLVDAFSSATYVINRLPTKLLLHQSPLQILFKVVPDYSNFKVFRCWVFPYLRPNSEHKLAPRNIAMLISWLLQSVQRLQMLGSYHF